MTEDMIVELPYTFELISELSGHDDRVWHVAWNPMQPLLASCSADKSVRLYAYRQSPDDSESSTFSHVSTIVTGHEKTVRAVAWAPSGKTLATASFDSNIGIWEKGSGDDGDEDGLGDEGVGEWECVSLLEGHETECKSVSYSSTGTLLASCSRDKTVWVWEVQPDADFECLGVLMEHAQDVKCIAWHPTEEILASASYDDTIKLYIDDPSEDWFCFSTLTGHTSTVWSLAWEPDGRYFASASDDRTVRVWKRTEEYRWVCVLVLEGHDRAVYSVSWGPSVHRDGVVEKNLGWVASTGSDGVINVWELSESEGNVKQKLIARHSSAHGVNDVNAVSWCPRSGYHNLLATAGDDGMVRVWRMTGNIGRNAPSSLPTKPTHFDIERVIRPNILALHPYRCARDDYKAGILLDANENALGHSIPVVSLHASSDSSAASSMSWALDLDLHRYPDPSHDAIKARIVDIRGLPSGAIDHVFLGVGSDEVIDLLMRVCVAPGKESILITKPTYGMYSVCAQVNDIAVVNCPLEFGGDFGEGGEQGRFSVRVDKVKEVIDNDPTIKLIFLCSPGNPTGTLISLSSIRALLEYENFKGIVVVDEAYVDFSGDNASAVSLVSAYANLCVMQTLSKSFGLAAIRLGIAIAQPPLIQILTNAKAPYNVSAPTAHLALAALTPLAIKSTREKIETLIRSREELLRTFATLEPLGLGQPIGQNNANFILIPVLDGPGGKPDNDRAQKVYRILAEEKGVVVRYRGGEPGCLGCLRITVGSREENEIMIKRLTEVLQ